MNLNIKTVGYFGYSKKELKGKKVFCVSKDGAFSDFEGTITGFKDNEDEFFIQVTDSDDNCYDCEYDEIKEIDGIDYSNLNTDVSIMKQDEIKGVVEILVKGNHQTIKDIQDFIVKEKIKKSDIIRISIDYYFKKENGDIQCCDLRARYFSVEELFNL